MARTGSPTILYAARLICRMVAIYGASDLGTKYTQEFRTAVLALVAACQAFEALDDQPGQIDGTAPIRSGEDLPAS